MHLSEQATLRLRPQERREGVLARGDLMAKSWARVRDQEGWGVVGEGQRGPGSLRSRQASHHPREGFIPRMKRSPEEFWAVGRGTPG